MSSISFYSVHISVDELDAGDDTNSNVPSTLVSSLSIYFLLLSTIFMHLDL